MISLMNTNIHIDLLPYYTTTGAQCGSRCCSYRLKPFRSEQNFILQCLTQMLQAEDSFVIKMVIGLRNLKNVKFHSVLYARNAVVPGMKDDAEVTKKIQIYRRI